MKRCLSVLLSLTGVLLLMAVVSGCKPETRSRPAQQVSAATAQPTATSDAVATTATVTATLNKPPACQFNNTAPSASSPSATSYTFSEPAVVYTRTGSGILSIYGWLPDSSQLMINDYDENIHRYTIEVLDVQTGKTRRYVERQSPGWIGWLPQLQALAYVDSEHVNSAMGTVRRDLWISRGDPKQATRVASGINSDSLAVSSDGRLTFFNEDQSNQPSGSQLQQLDIAIQAKQVTSLDLAQWDFSDSPLATQDSQVRNRRIRSIWRPGQTSQALLYSIDSGMLLADTQTGEICRISIRQQDKPLLGSLATWSLDGRYLAMLVEPAGAKQHWPSLLVVDMNTGQQFYRNSAANGAFGTSVIDMEWGPNSRHLIALKEVVPSNTSSDMKYELYLIDVLAQTAQQVLPDATLGGGSSGSGEMDWSPDGHYLAINCPVSSPGRPIIEDQVCLISTHQIAMIL